MLLALVLAASPLLAAGGNSNNNNNNKNNKNNKNKNAQGGGNDNGNGNGSGKSAYDQANYAAADPTAPAGAAASAVAVPVSTLTTTTKTKNKNKNQNKNKNKNKNQGTSRNVNGTASGDDGFGTSRRPRPPGYAYDMQWHDIVQLGFAVMAAVVAFAALALAANNRRGHNQRGYTPIGTKAGDATSFRTYYRGLRRGRASSNAGSPFHMVRGTDNSSDSDSNSEASPLKEAMERTPALTKSQSRTGSGGCSTLSSDSSGGESPVGGLMVLPTPERSDGGPTNVGQYTFVGADMANSYCSPPSRQMLDDGHEVAHYTLPSAQKHHHRPKGSSPELMY